MANRKSKKSTLLKMLYLSLTILLTFCITASAANGKIVIDPGHDNNDPGSQHSGVNESDVNA